MNRMKDKMTQGHGVQKVTIFSLIMTLGIIYGDIGTSPMYVMSAIMRANNNFVDPAYVIGGISLVIWTLTMQTTIKYVTLILHADNNGEGGILSLYTLLRKNYRKLLIPAIIGSAALLADSIITPPVTVTAAIEGLDAIISIDKTMIIFIVAIIITLLFLIQRFGTGKIGKVFGVVMFIWFGTLGLIGINGLVQNLSILKALNPYYGIKLLFTSPVGFLILGAVFLCTTGAEALYSDLGHCGKKNIYYTWVFVKISLVLNYLGQGAVLLQHTGQVLDVNPFFYIMPSWFTFAGVILATAAAIIASQSLIAGSFTLISEAIKLNLFPRLTISYPTDIKGQVYIPTINFAMWLGCMFILFHFKEAANMEAAYGLSITIAMLMTSFLFFFYLHMQKIPKIFSYIFIIVYTIIEGAFLYSNLFKFFDGGYITVIVGLLIMLIMYIWIKASEITKEASVRVEIKKYSDKFMMLQQDASIPINCANLVYLTQSAKPGTVENKVIHSILDRQPKKAKVYWFVNVKVTDDPYTMEYQVDTIEDKKIFKIHFYLGFRVEAKLGAYLRVVIQEMLENNELDDYAVNYRMDERNRIGDVKFILLRDVLTESEELSGFDMMILRMKLAIKKYSVAPAEWFGIETSNVETEVVPLLVPQKQILPFKRLP